ncbi:putative ribonuclease H-like domain-containing protein [Senna tora]|uniref:Putative ribonuclease H-like domain-containing protein n=1 Tax=Senna tora TaxID=362788 RepID=A0A834TKK5_9FABA|nr:putative ribonuclease H-like domain-containing protein [Senna tora]
MAVAGVIRNHMGHWVSGFSEFIGPGCSLTAEIWGLFLGLKLARELGRSYFNLIFTGSTMLTARRTDVLIFWLEMLLFPGLLLSFSTQSLMIFLVFWVDLSGIKYTRNCRGTFDPG